jgi:hypothetical protein
VLAEIAAVARIGAVAENVELGDADLDQSTPPENPTATL